MMNLEISAFKTEDEKIKNLDLKNKFILKR